MIIERLIRISFSFLTCGGAGVGTWAESRKCKILRSAHFLQIIPPLIAESTMSDFNHTEQQKASPAMQNVQDLLVYCLENEGVVSDDIEFREEEESGVGVFLTNACKKGTTLISIPRALCISVELVKGYGPLVPVFEAFPDLADQQDEVLALGLLYSLLNEDVDCPWKPHAKTLPKSFNTTIFWDNEELDELKGHNVFFLTNMLKNRIGADFEALYEPIIDKFPSLIPGADLEFYAWALSIVYSRSLDITRHKVHERIIVPVLDMLNHSPFAADNPSDTFHYDEETDNVSYTNPSDLGPGHQCFAVYGHYPNAKLLYTYGFVVQNNPIRAIDLWTRVTPTVQGFEFKQKVLQENPLTNNQTYDFTGTIRTNYVSPALLATIRVIQADPSEYSVINNAFQGAIVSPRNELATYTSLKSLLLMRLKVEVVESERKQLGELLLNNTRFNDRKLMALIVKVEERELVKVREFNIPYHLCGV